MLPTAFEWLVLWAGDGGFEIPRGPLLAVGLTMAYMGARQLRDPGWSAGQSARYRARREGLDVEDSEPTPAAVERARKGGYALLGLGSPSSCSP